MENKMEYTEAGKFIRNKRKAQGFSTQKKFIAALLKADPQINCSESYMSLIESGVKSPSLHLLDLMSSILQMTPQEKGELLLIYKRVPNDFEFAVRTNLKESLKESNLDKLKNRYESDKNKQNFDNLIRVLILEGKQQEASELLNSSPEFSLSVVDLQDRTAKMAAITGNYDFAIQAFNLALETCTDEYPNTKADILMNIGICYFSKAEKMYETNIIDFLELIIKSESYFKKSLDIWKDYIYCLDEYARCSYRIADALLYFVRNDKPLDYNKKNHQLIDKIFSEYKGNKSKELIYTISQEYFSKAIKYYKKILSHLERGDLPEKALKEAVYFYAYSLCKIKDFDEALLWINSINILEQNWITHFTKACYCNMRYEEEKEDFLLDEALVHLNIAYEFEPETVKHMIKEEKDKDLKTIWEKRSKELKEISEKLIHVQ